ncbi:hypothetical protein OOT33_17135 [Sphingobium sp. DEHP117]|uniref:hypothetical protein n=1 Tax=Sphingobium sp. DEHP117 TaxID=2993436 RepID=UPI0027D6818D|nr:hypothetical protein [Sphingobium sp. DEHP117]MDQ4422138.1 hypothetical protein [Sphingobium sp. DEHP117]
MSNCYTHCCFGMTLTPAEAALLREAITLTDFLGDEPDEAEVIEHWQGLSEDFRALFAPVDDNSVSGFLKLFPDSDFPTFGTDFAFDERDDGTILVIARAEQFEPDAVASLLHRIVTVSLPIVATWSFDCDRHEVDAFGGGAFRIDTDGIHWLSTSEAFDRERFASRLVLTTRNDEEGLLFWNNEYGFGALEDADIYTEAEADELGTVIADEEPEWIALPRRLLG